MAAIQFGLMHHPAVQMDQRMRRARLPPFHQPSALLVVFGHCPAVDRIDRPRIHGNALVRFSQGDLAQLDRNFQLHRDLERQQQAKRLAGIEYVKG